MTNWTDSTKLLTIINTTNSGFKVLLEQDINTNYKSVLYIEFFDTKRKAVNKYNKLIEQHNPQIDTFNWASLRDRRLTYRG